MAGHNVCPYMCEALGRTFPNIYECVFVLGQCEHWTSLGRRPAGRRQGADKSITELTPAINTVCCWIKINNVRPKERHVILLGREGLYITLLYEGQ